MKALILLAAYVPLALLRGWVIALLWEWYVTDYFGLPLLTIVEAVGLGILVTVFLSRMPSKDEEERGVVYTLTWVVASPLLALGFGWLWSFAL